MLPRASQQTFGLHPALPSEQPAVLRVAAHLELQACPTRLESNSKRQLQCPERQRATSSKVEQTCPDAYRDGPAAAGPQEPGTCPCEACVPLVAR
jgi:hypothetical protein